MKHLLSLVMFACALAVSAASVKVADGGKAVSAIVIDKDANRTVKYAAKELQNYFQLITSAKLPSGTLCPAEKNLPSFSERSIHRWSKSSSVKTPPNLNMTATQLLPRTIPSSSTPIIRAACSTVSTASL